MSKPLACNQRSPYFTSACGYMASVTRLSLNCPLIFVLCQCISVVPSWNCLPMDIVCAPSLYSFKRRLKFFNLFIYFHLVPFIVPVLFFGFLQLDSLHISLIVPLVSWTAFIIISLMARWLHPYTNTLRVCKTCIEKNAPTLSNQLNAYFNLYTIPALCFL